MRDFMIGIAYFNPLIIDGRPTYEWHPINIELLIGCGDVTIWRIQK
jgi:hypothetical protein